MSERTPAAPTSILVGITLLHATACSGTSTPPLNEPAHAGDGGSAQAGSAAISGGGGAASGGATPVGTPLSWTADGFVAHDQNPFAIEGPFYFYSDCDPPSGLPCTMPDPSLTGADGKAGWSVDAEKVCIKGTAVKVQDMMFGAQWGAGLALDLNSKGGTPGTPAVKGTLDLKQALISGFSVDISGTGPAHIRINLTMPGVPDSNFVDAKVPGTTTFALGALKQGSWVTQKTPLDATKVEALQFQVFTTAASPTPYDFCVDAIRVIEDAANAGGI